MKGQEWKPTSHYPQEWKKNTQRQSVPSHDTMPSIYKEQAVLTPFTVPKPCKLRDILALRYKSVIPIKPLGGQ